MWPPPVATETGCIHTVAPGEKSRWKREWDAGREAEMFEMEANNDRDGRKDEEKYVKDEGDATHTHTQNVGLRDTNSFF